MAFAVFISHSSADKPVANAVCAGLENAGIRCWIAPRDVVGGLDYADQITEAVQNCRAVVLIFSSQANESRHVKAEIDAAFSEGKVLLPLRIERIQPSKGMSHYLRNTHWMDAQGIPTAEEIEKLTTTLKSLLSEAKTEPAASGEQQAQTGPARRQKKAVLWGVILFLLVLLISGGGFATWRYLQQKHETSDAFRKTEGLLADAWLALGNVKAAETAFAKSEWQPERARRVAGAVLMSGDRSGALQILMRGGDDKKSTEYQMIELEAENGAIKQAAESLAELEKSGRDDQPGADARLAILLASVNSASFALPEPQFDTMLEEARELIDDDSSHDGYIRSGRLAEVLALNEDEEEARAEIKVVTDDLPEKITTETAPIVAAVLEAYSGLDDLTGADSFYSKLKIESGADVAMLPLVNDYLAEEQLERTKALALSGNNPQSQRAVLEALIENNALKEAEAFVKEAKITGVTAPVLLGTAFEKAGDGGKAKEWYDKATSEVRSRRSKLEQADGFAEMAEASAEAGNSKQAEESMAQAQKLMQLF